ncbi:complement C1q-like protein 4 [Perca flavescens]|uniref:complement C1q-like protein 4 n=1 Tax=Perca flavescens TaxID=8167 RepID=UPI00106E54E4|nr:complement C1q-like protein 4 [Perca flavescens]
MKISVSVTLLLLLGCVSTSEGVEIQPASAPDIYAELRELTASLVQLKADMTTGQAQQKAEADRLKAEVDKQKTEVDKQKNEVDRLKQQLQVQQVAFSASLLPGGQTATTGPFNSPATLIYKHVPTNIGNAYNSNTGVFTAPVRGAYHFEWTITAYGDNSHASGASLVKNTEYVFLAWENQSANYMSASNGATLLLEVGDVVFVRLRADSKAYDDGNHVTTFSGHLLFPM